MSSPTPTQAFRNNVPRTRSSLPSRTGAPSPSTFTSSPSTPAKLPSLVQRRRSKPEATQHHYPFEDLNISTSHDSIMAQLSLASTPTVQAPARAPIASPKAYVVVTDANFKARPHRLGDCLAHPFGCSCEKVQRPTMGQNEAWQVMSMRFKAVHDTDVCWNQRHVLLNPLSTGANAPLQRRESEPLPHLAAATNVEDLRESEPRGGKSVEKVLLPTRRTGPAVLAVPTRVATKLKLQAKGHDSRAGAASRARDSLPTSPARLSLRSRAAGGVHVNYL
ncbi:hypothetical protein T484DRAFT_1854192 [Baffinella frigidus]|nr:hypothetical protein T484DRAFT_1854192 [Cryptophyta sp. CCMP2293]